MALGLMAW